MITEKQKKEMFDYVYEVLKNSVNYTKIDKREDGFLMEEKRFGNPRYLFLHTDKKNQAKVDEKITKIVRNNGTFAHVFYNDNETFMRKVNFETQLGFMIHQIGKVIELSSYEDKFVKGYISSFNPEKERIQTNYLNTSPKRISDKLFVLGNPVVIKKDLGLIIDNIGIVVPDDYVERREEMKNIYTNKDSYGSCFIESIGQSKR